MFSLNKKTISIVCVLFSFSEALHAQQPPVVRSADFIFHRAIPSLEMMAAVTVARPVLDADNVLMINQVVAAEMCRSYDPEGSLKKLALADLQKAKNRVIKAESELSTRCFGLSDYLLRLINVMCVHKRSAQKIAYAITTNDRELFKLGLSESTKLVKESVSKLKPLDTATYHQVALDTLVHSPVFPENIDEQFSFIEELLIRAPEVTQHVYDGLLSNARRDTFFLLLYGGVLTTDSGARYPIRGGARDNLLGELASHPLHYSVATGDFSAKSETDLDVLRHRELPLKKRNLWWKSIEENTVCALEKALGENADINQATNEGDTLLHIATGYSTPRVVAYLLERGAQVNKANASGHTPLHDAVFHRDLCMLQVLLQDENVSVDAQDGEGINALHIAAAHNDIDAIRILVNSGARLDIKNNVGVTPLQLASLEGHGAAVRMLIDYGADIELQDNDGETALYKAADNMRLEVVQLLLDKGACAANLASRFEQPPVYSDNYERSVEIRKLLKNAAIKQTIMKICPIM